MAVEYPDILGDVVEARQRWEVDGVQYMARLEPETIAPGQATTLSIALQSVLDVPITLRVAIDVPKGPHGLAIAQTQTNLTLEGGEVGRLNIPVQAPAQIRAGSYPIRLDLRGTATGRGQRTRSQQSRGHLPATPIKDTVGLELASTIGIGYSAKSNSRIPLKLTIRGQPEPTEVDLAPTFAEIWKFNDLELQVRATKEFNDRRIHIVKPLTRPVVFTAMLNESRQRFADSGVQLMMGEAVFIAKILTRTVEMFTADGELQEALYVPIFQRLLASNVPFDSPIWLLMKVGFEHVVNLAAALSFGLLHDYKKGPIWPLEEQRVARRFIVTQLTNRDALSIDLVYVPLILGGLLASDQVVMPGENMQESLDALSKAKASRLTELSQEDDQVILLLDELLAARKGR